MPAAHLAQRRSVNGVRKPVRLALSSRARGCRKRASLLKMEGAPFLRTLNWYKIPACHPVEPKAPAWNPHQSDTRSSSLNLSASTKANHVWTIVTARC